MPLKVNLAHQARRIRRATSCAGAGVRRGVALAKEKPCCRGAHALSFTPQRPGAQSPSAGPPRGYIARANRGAERARLDLRATPEQEAVILQ